MLIRFLLQIFGSWASLKHLCQNAYLIQNKISFVKVITCRGIFLDHATETKSYINFLFHWFDNNPLQITPQQHIVLGRLLHSVFFVTFTHCYNICSFAWPITHLDELMSKDTKGSRRCNILWAHLVRNEEQLKFIIISLFQWLWAIIGNRMTFRNEITVYQIKGSKMQSNREN